MPSPVELIKERLGIAEVVGSFVTLQKSGASLKAKCPFHNERTPSFFVSPERGTYYCFGCGAKGDVFSFVQAFEGLDFMGALRSLAARAGVELVRENPRERSERERLFLLLEAATHFFQRELSGNKPAMEYLTGRGLTEETIHEWRIGVAADAWRECLEFAREKGFSDDEILQAGLVKREGGKIYDRFRSRVMFPISDSAGRVVAFSGRILGKESENIPKYLNSPETSIFSKSRILYGLDKAKLEIRRHDYTILVEGQMDLLMCHQAGFKNAVASSGTAFTDEHIMLLKRLSRRILMVYDGDRAGVTASLRSASLALSAGLEVKIAALPKGTDPAELLRTNVPAWKEILKSSKHVIEFYLDEIMSENLEGRTLARALRDRLLPYLVSLESSIEREHFISHIALRSGIREQAIREDIAKIKTPARTGEIMAEKKTTLGVRRGLAPRLLLGLAWWQKSVPTSTVDITSLETEIKRVMGAPRFNAMLSEAEPMRDELMYQAESYYRTAPLEAVTKDLLTTLEEDVLVEDLSAAMRKLAEAERTKNKEQTEELLALCHNLTGRLNTVRASRHTLQS